MTSLDFLMVSTSRKNSICSSSSAISCSRCWSLRRSHTSNACSLSSRSSASCCMIHSSSPVRCLRLRAILAFSSASFSFFHCRNTALPSSSRRRSSSSSPCFSCGLNARIAAFLARCCRSSRLCSTCCHLHRAISTSSLRSVRPCPASRARAIASSSRVSSSVSNASSPSLSSATRLRDSSASKYGTFLRMLSATPATLASSTLSRLYCSTTRSLSLIARLTSLRRLRSSRTESAVS
mmetsp:Transcript_1852/g.4838  ORF Transcript_1852/g.4838 Transcript_1852/m.4838 type:complete len:237 (+) Transcript_1852:435-1145(+)